MMTMKTMMTMMTNNKLRVNSSKVHLCVVAQLKSELCWTGMKKDQVACIWHTACTLRTPGTYIGPGSQLDWAIIAITSPGQRYITAQYFAAPKYSRHGVHWFSAICIRVGLNTKCRAFQSVQWFLFDFHFSEDTKGKGAFQISYQPNLYPPLLPPLSSMNYLTPHPL